ncbi:MAG: L-tyrosine/L-tryptophan isonitrile synthase family protein [Oligoflexales bacterium]
MSNHGAGPVGDLATEIISIVFKYRRSLEDAHDYRHFCEQCNFPHIDRIRASIESGRPIHFVLPAFPAKSPNLDKVLGKLPDKGEELALDFLQSLCVEIRNLYAPGAKITICSDGHVFADVVRVEDGDVDAYNSAIKGIIRERQLSCLETYGLWDIFGNLDYNTKRSRLVSEHGQSHDEIKALIKKTPRELAMFNGIERFLVEDFSYIESGKSRNAIRKMCHELAYTTIQRSHAWSTVVEKEFPEAIRLSIHPQPCHYQKLGIYLIESKNNWLTPWHGVAVKVGGKFVLMKKSEVISRGAAIVNEDGRPSYFIAESVS